MSMHGTCFDNGMSGRCGPDCMVLLEGNCDCVDEVILENLLDCDELNDEDKLELINHYAK